MFAGRKNATLVFLDGEVDGEGLQAIGALILVGGHRFLLSIRCMVKPGIAGENALAATIGRNPLNVKTDS